MSNTTVGPGNSPYNSATVTEGNTLTVSSGGVADDTSVANGGTMTVAPGGAEDATTIESGGTEFIAGLIASSGTNGNGGSGNAVVTSATAASDIVYGTMSVGPGVVITDVTVENGGVLDIYDKSTVVNGADVHSGGTLIVNGNSAVNGLTLDGGTLELESSKADYVNSGGLPSASGGLIFGAGYSSTIDITTILSGSNSSTQPIFAQTISGFAQGDMIETAISGGQISSESTSGNITTVTISGGSKNTETFSFANVSPASLEAVDIGSGKAAMTELIVTCYVSGTLIRTFEGDVPVERLAIGDLVATASGGFRPIRWLGHRTTDCRQHPRPQDVMPVRIAAHAFGPDRPARDLWVSPGHSICVDMLGEVLIPASRLINDATIQQIDVERITYWHVELDSHDIILAENLPAESYLEMGNRSFFKENGVTRLDAVADATLDFEARTHADFCHPFHESGTIVDAVRFQLRKRAFAAGWSLSENDPFAGLHLVVDGLRVEPSRRGMMARFSVPAGANDVWLVSEISRPRGISDNPDDRRLGVCVSGLTVDDGFGSAMTIDLADPLLAVGFYELEEGVRRWTTGRAQLPSALWAQRDRGGEDEGFYLRVELAAPALPRWINVEVGEDANVLPERPLLALLFGNAKR